MLVVHKHIMNTILWRQRVHTYTHTENNEIHNCNWNANWRKRKYVHGDDDQNGRLKPRKKLLHFCALILNRIICRINAILVIYKATFSIECWPWVSFSKLNNSIQPEYWADHCEWMPLDWFCRKIAVVSCFSHWVWLIFKLHEIQTCCLIWNVITIIWKCVKTKFSKIRPPTSTCDVFFGKWGKSIFNESIKWYWMNMLFLFNLFWFDLIWFYLFFFLSLSLSWFKIAIPYFTAIKLYWYTSGIIQLKPVSLKKMFLRFLFEKA